MAQAENRPGEPAPQNTDPSLQQAATAEQVRQRLEWIQSGAEAIGGPGARVEDVFPLATDTRRDAPEPNWTTQQITEAREVAHRFGYGAEQDVPSGLRGGRRILEGGLYWKMRAEEEAVAVEGGVAEVIFAGTTHRTVGDNERAVIQQDIDQLTAKLEASPPTERERPEDIVDRALTGIHQAGLKSLLRPEATEYDIAQVLAERRATEGVRGNLEAILHLTGDATEYDPTKIWLAYLTRASEGEGVLPFGYQVLPGAHIAPSRESTGQLRQVGVDSEGERVRLLRVDREYYDKPGTDKREYSQPDAAALMGFIAGVADAEGAPDDPIGLITSNSYASRVPDSIRAGLGTGHQYGVGMYGRETLAETRHAPIQPETPELNQLPGELRSMYEKLRQLGAEVGVGQ